MPLQCPNRQALYWSKTLAYIADKNTATTKHLHMGINMCTVAGTSSNTFCEIHWNYYCMAVSISII